MNPRFLRFAAFSLFLVGLILAGGWLYRDLQPTREAWLLLDPAEKQIIDVSEGQRVQASFRLKNASPQPHRILGGSVC